MNIHSLINYILPHHLETLKKRFPLSPSQLWTIKKDLQDLINEAKNHTSNIIQLKKDFILDYNFEFEDEQISNFNHADWNLVYSDELLSEFYDYVIDEISFIYDFHNDIKDIVYFFGKLANDYKSKGFTNYGIIFDSIIDNLQLVKNIFSNEEFKINYLHKNFSSEGV
jgi:hypothetical protein